MNVSHGGSNYGLPKATNNVQLRQNVQLKQGGIGMPAHQRSTSTQENYPSYAPELVKNGAN